MKVLQVTGAYPVPPLGGMELTVFTLGREYARLGCDAVAVAPTPGLQRAEIAGTRFIGLPSRRLSNWIKVPTFSSYRELERWVLWADVVHIHNPPELFCYLASRIAWGAQKPVICAVVSPGALRSHPRWTFRVLGSVDELLVTEQLKRASIVQVKNAIDRSYVSAITQRLRYLPDGVPNDFFRVPRDPSNFLADRGLEGRHPVLLYLGRLHAMKGPMDYVNAVSILSKQWPGLLALLVGPASSQELSRLRFLVKSLDLEKQILYMGPVSEADKIRVIDCSNVVVVPSLADFVEGFSMTSSEAWARGKPVAGYAVGALRARVVDGVNGFLAKPGNPTELAQAIMRACRLTEVTPPSDVLAWSDVAEELYRWCRSLAGISGPTTSGRFRISGPAIEK